ncbi:putative lipid II flippase FtsW [Candidatus Bipolaricaulota bacterium]|nr:putative lipid II flippase FtsW [Candidatus Bipolaricaulota bacterium]
MELQADRATWLVTFVLLGSGLIMLYSASSPFSLAHFDSDTYMIAKQAIAAAIGVGLCMFLALVDYRRLAQLDELLLIGAFLVTVLTLLPINGFSDGRWLNLGVFNLQPTELLKVTLVVYLAAAMTRKGARMVLFSQGVLPFLIVIALIAVVVIQQPDLGMILVFCLLTLLMLFLGGARLLHLAAVAVGAVPVVCTAVLIAPYRMARIVSFLNPQAYSTSSGYQTLQSLIAVGSGGVFGRGLGASRTKLFYLPQAHNDFVFSVIAEELGLIGALGLLALFALLVWRAFAIASQTTDRFGQLLAYGIGICFALQVVLNVGVTLGLLPVTGLTLPFVSNGGSSLLVMLALCGLLLSVSRYGGQPCGS